MFDILKTLWHAGLQVTYRSIESDFWVNFTSKLVYLVGLFLSCMLTGKV